MATAERQARIVWEGPLQAGSGELEFVSSGIGSYAVTWASRVQRADGRTSPEELLAASHATCYAMALNGTLGRDNPPERLEVTATVSLDPKEGGGFQVTSSALEATGVVPGLDQAKFQEGAEGAGGDQQRDDPATEPRPDQDEQRRGAGHARLQAEQPPLRQDDLGVVVGRRVAGMDGGADRERGGGPEPQGPPDDRRSRQDPATEPHGAGVGPVTIRHLRSPGCQRGPRRTTGRRRR